MSGADYLRGLFKANRKPLVVAHVIGVSLATVYAYARSCRVPLPERTKPTVRVGRAVGTLEWHCENAKVSYGAVRTRMSRGKLTAEQAINDQIKNDMTYKRGAFKAVVSA